MCNLYSITTHQAAIIALFHVINRYVGNLAADAGCLTRLPGSSDPQQRERARDGDDAMGYAATAAHARSTRHQHTQYIIATLPHLAEAGASLLGAVQ